MGELNVKKLSLMTRFCAGFHQYLLDRGIDPRNLEETANKLSILSSTGGSGGVIDVFYQVSNR